MYLKLAWRNIWRNKRRTLITVSSIMFAVVSALFVESMEQGAHDQMIGNMTSFHTGYIQIQDYRYEEEPSLDNAFYFDDSFEERIKNRTEQVEIVTPRIETFMLAAGEEITRGTMVLGIDPEKEQKLNNIHDRLSAGRFFESGEGTAVIGSGLAGRLNLAVGDTLVLLGQGRFGTTASGLFKISGLIDHPLREMNNQVVYLSLPDAQWLLSAEDRITNLLINPASQAYTAQVASSLKDMLENEELRVLTWREMMPELIDALEFDRASSRVFMGILYVVIGFGIFGTILTMTLERTREFGILLSVGMYRTKLAFVVFIETFFISILGVIAGFVLGLLVLLYFILNPIELSGDIAELVLDFGFEPILPMALSPEIFLWQGVVIFLITMIICLYPSLKIARMNILKAKT